MLPRLLVLFFLLQSPLSTRSLRVVPPSPHRRLIASCTGVAPLDRSVMRSSLSMRRTGLLAVAILVAMAVGVASAVRVGLKQRVFRPQNLPAGHLSSSDPANNPLTAQAFLEGGADSGPLVNSWHDAFIDAPQAQAIEQEVLVASQASAASQRNGAPSDASFLEREGLPASAYEPKKWMADLSPKPYVDLAVPHNKIEGALGVASAAIPWDYRSYAGQLNTHRKAEPLIYTPMVIAKDESGESAVDLTSLVNRKYQLQRNSIHPEYAAALSADTEYSPLQKDPTGHWMPQIPLQNAPKKSWEKHFLDLYAPTPPPLLAPVAPRMRKTASQERKERSMMEMRSRAAKAVGPLPSFLSQREHVQAMVTPLFDSHGAALKFHDQSAEDARRRLSHEVDIFAPAHAPSPVPTAARVAQQMMQDSAPAVFLELEDMMVQEDGLEAYDIDLPFPEAQHKDVFPW